MMIHDQVVHVLEVGPEAFERAAQGVKPWEYRYNDQGYLEGDWVELVETPGVRKKTFSISYVEPVGPLGYCVMTLWAP